MKLRQETVGFSAGELSEDFFGRHDLDKFPLGVSKSLNFIPNYRGSLSSRPGFRFCDFARGDGRIVPFFTGTAQNDVLCIFTLGKLSFMQDGRYLLEVPKVVTAVAANVVTSAAHGYAIGDLVYLAGTTLPTYTYEIIAVTVNTFTVRMPHQLIPANSGALSSPTVARIFTLATPYAAGTDLNKIKFKQHAQELIVTSTDFPRYKLAVGAPFTFTVMNDLPVVSAVTSVTAVPSAAGAARMVFAVTTVDGDGKESSSPLPILVTSSVNYVTTAGSMALSWAPVAGAVSYRVYRSVITENTTLSTAAQLGFIGETLSPSLVDQNIQADFTRVPPVFYAPFANGTLLHIEVTAGGSGYVAVPTVAVAGGTGFQGYVVVENQIVRAVVIQNGGSDFEVGDAVSFAGGGGGSGATAVIASVTPLTGNYPSSSTVFQQRRIYGGTDNLPTTVFGTETGKLENFSLSGLPLATDSFTLTADFKEAVPIEHVEATRNGVLLMHSNGIERLAAAEGRALGPTNYSIEQEVAVGVGRTQPSFINNDIVFLNPSRTSVYALAYTYYSNSYSAQDVSVFASHLLDTERRATAMAWVEEPSKCLWFRRQDGRLLSLTYAREQEVFAWAQHQTQGLAQDITSLREGDDTILYMLVRRWLNGGPYTTIEKLTSTEYALQEDYVGADSALSYAGVLLESTGSISISGTTVTSNVLFGSVAVGDHLRAWGGKFEVTAKASASSLTVVELEPPTAYLPETTMLLPLSSWKFIRPQTELTGLWHLEGLEVSVLADGSVYNRTVEDGSVTIAVASSAVTVGLPYTCEAVTLPLSIYERMTDGDISRLISANVRLIATRGLQYGPLGGKLYPIKDKGYEDYGQPPRLRSAILPLSFSGKFVRDMRARFLQTYPLPATIASLILDLEVAD